LRGLPSTTIPVNSRPSAASDGMTVSGSSVLLLITADTVTRSPTTKNRGA
jgi:hypothetical protein